MNGEDAVQMRNMPNSELDLNLMLTDSVWGRSEVSQELRDRLNKFYVQYGSDGQKVVTKASLWGLLGFYTRDMRLANLSTFDNEIVVCRFYIELANDLLNSNMIESFIIALSKAATILETSQSKGGFLRKTMNTLRQEHINQQMEPPKKGFFGGKKNEGGMNYG